MHKHDVFFGHRTFVYTRRKGMLFAGPEYLRLVLAASNIWARSKSASDDVHVEVGDALRCLGVGDNMGEDGRYNKDCGAAEVGRGFKKRNDRGD